MKEGFDWQKYLAQLPWRPAGHWQQLFVSPSRHASPGRSGLKLPWEEWDYRWTRWPPQLALAAMNINCQQLLLALLQAVASSNADTVPHLPTVP